MIPLVAAAAPTVLSAIGSILVPTMLDAITRGEPSAEDKAKVQDILNRLSMQRAQEKGIPVAKAREEIMVEAGPMLEKGIQSEPGLLQSLAVWGGGGLVGGLAGAKLGGKIAAKYGKKAAAPAAAAPAAAAPAAAAPAAAAPAAAAPAPAAAAPAFRIPGQGTGTGSVAPSYPVAATGGPKFNTGPEAAALAAQDLLSPGAPAPAPSLTSVDSVLQGAAAPAKKSRKGAAPAAPAAPATPAAVTNPDDILAKEAAANGLTTDQVMAELAALNAARTAGGGAAAHPSIAALMGASL